MELNNIIKANKYRKSCATEILTQYLPAKSAKPSFRALRAFSGVQAFGLSGFGDGGAGLSREMWYYIFIICTIIFDLSKSIYMEVKRYVKLHRSTGGVAYYRARA